MITSQLCFCRVGDAVADAGPGFDGGRVAEFAAQSAEGVEDGVGEGVGIFVPDLFEQLFGAQEGGRGAEQGFEDAELLNGQVDGPAVAGGGAALRVEGEAGGVVDAGPGPVPDARSARAR